ncbi:NACHT and TPR domain protein [Arthroderma uncinatum]|uniref:NACHT and TPR domain protein n=1 Tax=Arthroderma uncinatum TaxID=74035 RepID=UPI00144A89F4|nr:NACHT and TPR domain protein [Arthroderma uncinatum]KAF3484169.1 NACHT and TPR domain protein [Arthroderma uncinatum]
MPGRTPRLKLSPHLKNILLVFFLLFPTVKASCECGFVINDTQDYYTHLIHNNFSAFSPTKPLSTNPKFTRDWAIQKWGLPVMNWATPLPILNRPENVYLEDGHLTLRQEGYPKESVLSAEIVSVASIASRASNILHGSFRANMVMENASGGSVAGFFWYHVCIPSIKLEILYNSADQLVCKQDDKNEIDIEILTREFKQDSMLVHYTTHPALDDRGWLISNATEIISLNGDRPSESFQVHRFDWTKEELRFYQNADVVHTNTIRVPTDEGSVYLNLWADGGMWSGSPSTTDVYLRVKYLSIYHNTSASENGTDSVFNQRCQKAGGLTTATVCYDVHINSGLQIPSSKSKSLTPLPLWALSIFCLGLTIIMIAML